MSHKAAVKGYDEKLQQYIYRHVVSIRQREFHVSLKHFSEISTGTRPAKLNRTRVGHARANNKDQKTQKTPCSQPPPSPSVVLTSLSLYGL